MPRMNKEQREAEAFREAVASLPSIISTRRLPRSVSVLRPRFPKKSLPVSAILYNFRAANAERESKRDLSGAVLAVNGSYVDEMIFFQNIGSSLAAAGNVTYLQPHSVVSEPRETKARRGREAVTAFAHIVLLHRRGARPAVFLSCFQKNMGRSRSTRGAYVDYHVGSQGPDRHFLHLALAEQIVKQMRKKGVDAELHVPVARHLHFRDGTPEETKERIRKPFRILEQHFEKSRLSLLGIPLTTLNLSRVRRRKG